MDLLLAFRTFIRVAESGSFSAVARELGTTQPAVSRQVAALEEHLRARLIQRTTRSLTLTEDGRDLLGHARQVLDAVEETESAIGKRRNSPSGIVRLGVQTSFGRLHVAPRLGRLLARYPDLTVELLAADNNTDLVSAGLDLSIRVANNTDQSLVARRIGSTVLSVVAAASYLDAHGTPASPEDLAAHDCILYLGAPAPGTWNFTGPDGPVEVPVSGRFHTDQGEFVHAAVRAGLGVAMMPTWLFGDEITSGEVQLLLRAWQPSRWPIQAVYPSRRNLAPRTRAVIDFLVDEFRLDPAVSSYGEAPHG